MDMTEKKFVYKKRPKKLQIIKDTFADIVDDCEHDIKIEVEEYSYYYCLTINIPQLFSEEELLLFYNDLIVPKLNYLESSYNIETFKMNYFLISDIIWRFKRKKSKFGNMSYSCQGPDDMSIRLHFK